MLPTTLHTAAAKPTEEKRGRGAQHRYWLFFNFPYMCSGSHENKIREDFVLKRSHFHRSWLCLVVIYKDENSMQMHIFFANSSWPEMNEKRIKKFF
jgi:hypothetical protein